MKSFRCFRELVKTEAVDIPTLIGAASCFAKFSTFFLPGKMAQQQTLPARHRLSVHGNEKRRYVDVARAALRAILGAAVLFCGTPAQAQLFVLHSFGGTPDDGSEPYRTLVANAGVLYGITVSGGAYGSGAAFRIGIDGAGFSVLRSFSYTDSLIGYSPSDRLVYTDGMLYGVNRFGGQYGAGTAYRMNTNGGDIALLHAFSGPDGKFPRGGPVIIGNEFYGMTWFGGGTRNNGTIFKTGLDGSSYAVLHFFNGRGGANPVNMLLADGNVLYGMTHSGGALLGGTVFRVNSDGTGYTILHNFAGGADDGATPYDGLVLSGNTLFGMTYVGGANDLGAIFRIGADGTGFSLLHSFSGTADGEYPYGSLTVVGEWLYGMTYSGGSTGQGTIFRIRPDGTGFSVVQEFSGANGSGPVGTLIYENGILYGVTGMGGDHNLGVVFALTLPAPPCQ
jgi:uncharacterized repeat protein (TIGR03803 family)